MYFVKYGETYLHDPRTNDYLLLDLTLDFEENSCGFCDFTIYPNHPMYDKIKERDSKNPIEVYDDDTLLFSGFIYELGKEFYMDGHVKCKGEMDYLSESIIRPYSTTKRGWGLTAPSNVNEYFEWLIKQHNDQVDDTKKFEIGVNRPVDEKRNTIAITNDSYPTVIDEISNNILESIGGYIRIRHIKGKRVIDYITEWTEDNSQILDFGVNLMDYTQTDNSEDVKTYIIPTGANMSETSYDYVDGYFVTSDTTVDPNKVYYTKNEPETPEERPTYSECTNLEKFEKGVTYYEYNENNDESNVALTIAKSKEDEYSIDDTFIKSGDRIYDKTSVKKYGWIGTTYSNSELNTVEELILYGMAVLKQSISPKRTIEIKAVDMHLLNPNMKSVKIGEYIRVRSNPHNVNSYFLCKSINLDLNNPENSTYILGTTYDTLTGEQNKKIKELNANINLRYDIVESISEDAKNTAKKAEDNSKVVLDAYESGELKGDKGDPGEKGADGEPGAPGPQGEPGEKGEDGKTPVKGVDYFTEEEVDEIQDNAVTAAVDSVQEPIQELKSETMDLKTYSDITTNNLTELKDQVIENQNETNENFEELHGYIRFSEGTITLGKEGNEIQCVISNDRFSFLQNGIEVAYLSDNKLKINRAELSNDLRVGNFAIKAETNGGLVIQKVIS